MERLTNVLQAFKRLMADEYTLEEQYQALDDIDADMVLKSLRELSDLEEQIGMPLNVFFQKLGKPKEFMVTVSGKRFYDATLIGGEFRKDGNFVYCVLVHDVQFVPFYDYFAKIYTHDEAEKKLKEISNEKKRNN